jgi:hypothetical protein
MNHTPFLANNRFYLLSIKYPSSIHLVKLVNVNDKMPTVKDVLKEFEIFYSEMVNVELATLVEYGDGASKCKRCVKGNFERFEVVDTSVADKCSICWSVGDAQIKLDCGHAVDLECIQKWFVMKNNCPICRACIEPCECGGTRRARPTSPRSFNRNRTARSTGIYRLQPYSGDDLTFTSLVYDRDNNMFHLKPSS